MRLIEHLKCDACGEAFLPLCVPLFHPLFPYHVAYPPLCPAHTGSPARFGRRSGIMDSVLKNCLTLSVPGGGGSRDPWASHKSCKARGVGEPLFATRLDFAGCVRSAGGGAFSWDLVAETGYSFAGLAAAWSSLRGDFAWYAGTLGVGAQGAEEEGGLDPLPEETSEHGFGLACHLGT